MGRIKDYFIRGIKYILKEYKQPIVKINVVQDITNNSLDKKVFIITGGGSGIGFEIAKRIVSENGLVVILGRNEEKLIVAQKELGTNCDYIVHDIENIKNNEEVFNNIFQKYNRIDGLINNAGISLHEWDFLKVTPEGFDKQININLKGSYFFTQEYIKQLLKKGLEGNVIFISSERGTMADVIPYGLTKTAINSLVKGLSYKYYNKGIRCNAISPGVTATEMTNINKFKDDMFLNNIPGRVFLPEEIAETVLYLLKDSSKCISGEIIHTNGGNHIKMGW